mgnify:CR=1 FL=1
MAPRQSTRALSKDFILDLLARHRSLDWRALAFTSALYFLFTLDLYIGHVGVDEITALVRISIGLVLGIGVLYVLRPVIAPISERNPLWRLALLYTSNGLITAIYFTIALGIPFIPPGHGVSAWVLLSTNGLITLVWNFLSHSVVSLFSSDLTLIRQLGAKTQALMQVRMEAQKQLSVELVALRETISVHLSNVLNRISIQVEGLSSATSPEDLVASASVVREICDREVRALSHEISSHEFSPSIDTRSTPRISELLSHMPLTASSIGVQWPVISAVGSVNALVIALQSGGWLAALAAILSVVVGLCALVAVDSLRRKYLPSLHPGLAMIVVGIEYLTVTEVVLIGLSALAGRSLELQRLIDSSYLIVPFVVMLLWLFAQSLSTLSEALKLHRTQLALENAELGEVVSRFQLRSRSARKRIGKLLHGTIQGRLASVSLALTAAASATQPEQVDELISQARRQLIGAASELEETMVLSSDAIPLRISEELAGLVEGWRNLVEIKVELEPHAMTILDGNREATELVAEAIQECLTNAVRHGQANLVEIRLSVGATLTLEVLNNGISPEGVVPGFGIRNIAEFASDLEVSQVEGKTLVRINWPVPS